MRMKKAACLLTAAMLSLSLFAGCQSGGGSSASDGGNDNSATFDSSKAVNVITRESGSGTRGAFIELFGIEEKDENGSKVDKTTDEASVQSSTNAVMTTVAGDVYAIGYISLGSLNDSVKALKIDGAEATAENVKNGTYKVSRPFNIATKATVSGAAQDFINFIMSAEGQKVIEDNHCISQKAGDPFTSNNASGKVVVAGSSSVTPVMEKLAEAYKEFNPNVTVDIQQSDSSTGMKMTAAGTCDIGMASRELKDSEKEFLTPTVIALDGIAVIVNKANANDDMTSESIKAIFTGKATKWSEVK